MLYDRWRRVALENWNQVALRDLGSGRQWTFAELWALGEAGSDVKSALAFPQGNSPEFLFELLRAWHSGQAVCPLEAGQTPPQSPTPPAWCVHLKTTSATTGPGRLVAFTAEQLAADADQIVATMRLRADWPNLGVVSLAHSYGFSNLVLPLLLHGIPLVLAPSALPEALRRAAATGPAWTLPAVPALWRAWHEGRAVPQNVRLAISAGAPLPADLEAAVYQATGTKIHNFYGSSECGGIAYDSNENPRRDDAEVGSPMMGVKLSLTPEGCLVVRGAAVATTYWPEPQAALGAARFQTSDLAELKDGKVRLLGRQGDLINLAGRKVAPEAIERVLVAHPAVLECLVLGLPGTAKHGPERVAAVVALRHAATIGELRRFLQQRLPAWQLPRAWRFVDSLATSQRGKNSRAEWRRRFLEEKALAP